MRKPKIRSKIRITFGKFLYRNLRYAHWLVNKSKYAKLRKDMPTLAFTVFKHQTPLLRKLKDVDMWLQYNKVKNLSIAVKKLNTVTLQPGETFSYWKLIGKPTRRKGYVEGMVLNSGKVGSGIGGGLCQLSNLIYWLTLHTPLTVYERYRHSYDVFPDANRTQPFGSGATCAYNYIDLQIFNGTTEPYQLIISMSEEHLIGEWKTMNPLLNSYEIYEKKHWITYEYWGAYVRHNQIFRKVFSLDGQCIDDEFITENHALMMYEPLLAEGIILTPTHLQKL